MYVESYTQVVWNQFRKSKIGLAALILLAVFFLLALYAPLLASSQPLLVLWQKKLYFPLLRHLFYRGYFSKPIDLFYNLMMFTLPITLIGYAFIRRRSFLLAMVIIQTTLFFILLSGFVKDPKSNPRLWQDRQKALQSQVVYREDPLLEPIKPYQTWSFELGYMTDYAKLGKVLQHISHKKQHERLIPYASKFEQKWHREMPTLWSVARRHESEKQTELKTMITSMHEQYGHAVEKLPEQTEAYRPFSHEYLMAKYDFERGDLDQEGYQEILSRASEARLALSQTRQFIQRYRDASAELTFLEEKNNWLNEQAAHLKILIPPLLRDFHWEDDAGGAQGINQVVPWWELTRINRKDLVSSLLFGIRVSLVVGVSAVVLALLIGIPLGAISGYFAGKTDLVISRIIEIWEAMPTFFMLLLVVALMQSKSIFLVIAVLAVFGWTSFARYMRAEVLKQRSLSYVLACKSLGFRHTKIMFSHILPNAIPPILTLLPFAMMAAITSEAGLSFLGLGEEGATSWGVLMDEGRSAFPAESYLLWPPAILLTLLLVCIALVGDVLRDALDPKMRT